MTIRDTRELGLYLTFFQKQWGGVINGANVFISARCSWYWYIFPFEVHFSPAKHLKSNHMKVFERFKLLQKGQKLTKNARKSGKSEFAISRENALVAKLNKTESSPLTLFSKMIPSWWKVRKKCMSENFCVLEGRTTLIRRRIDVMVGSPSKKSWRTWNICGFLENCWWQTWLSPIQYEQSSSQHYEFDQKMSILKCTFVIGTRMNTLLWNG